MTLRAWRRQSAVVNFWFLIAEQIDAALPLRLPIVTGFSWLLLQGPLALREMRRKRKASAPVANARAAR